MLLLTEDGITYIKIFIAKLAEKTAFYKENQETYNIQLAIIVLLSQLANRNDIDEIQKSLSNDIETIKTIDNGKGSVTPTIFNKHSKDLFINYLEFLKGLFKNWSDYIPLTTRAFFSTGFKIKERIENAIKVMELELELYQRREDSESVVKFLDNLDVEKSTLFNRFRDKFINRKQFVEQDFEAMYVLLQPIQKLPNTYEVSSAVACLNYANYVVGNNKSYTKLFKAEIIRNFIVLEKELTLLAKDKNRDVSFSKITKVFETKLDNDALEQFKASFDKHVGTLIQHLTDYVSENNGHANKLKLASSLINTLSMKVQRSGKEERAQLCVEIVSAIKKSQHDHYLVLIREGIEGARLEEILNDGLKAFSNLVGTIAWCHFNSIKQATDESLEVLNGEQAGLTI